ncbi:MAG: glycosyltransferase [bacterium]
MDALFIVDKWCHGVQANGISAWESNLVNSYRTVYQEKRVQEFNFDVHRSFDDRKTSINKTLLRLIEQCMPRFVFLVIYEKPSQSDKIISLNALKRIRELGIPIITIFGDLEHQLQCEILRLVKPFCDLIYFTALTSPGERLKLSKLRYTWVPKDPAIFYSDELSKNRDIGVLYLGTPKPDRVSRIKYLSNNGIKVFSTGGERAVNLPVTEYASLLRRSQISLSFSRADGNHVTNARAFEVISCGAMLLEEEGMETAKLFRPYLDYIPFFGRRDLLDKCKYYLKNDLERQTIAVSAANRMLTYFSAKRFWDEIEDFINNIDRNRCIELQKNADIACIDRYWSLGLSQRSIPAFNMKYYKDFPIRIRFKYKVLDLVGKNIFLNWFHKKWFNMCQLPRRVVFKMYLMFYKKK